MYCIGSLLNEWLCDRVRLVHIGHRGIDSTLQVWHRSVHRRLQIRLCCLECPLPVRLRCHHRLTDSCRNARSLRSQCTPISSTFAQPGPTHRVQFHCPCDKLCNESQSVQSKVVGRAYVQLQYQASTAEYCIIRHHRRRVGPRARSCDVQLCPTWAALRSSCKKGWRNAPAVPPIMPPVHTTT